MSTATKWVLILGGIAILICILIVKCGNNLTPSIDTTTHDTVIKKVFVYDTVKAPIDVPTLVTQYITVPQRDTVATLLILHDTIRIYHIDTLEHEIPATFITTFPESPKLILGEFSTNSLSLNLLGTDGLLVKKQWNVDYSKYSYEFSGTELHNYPLPKTENIISRTINQFTTSSYMYAYYLPFTQGATIKLDYTIAYKRLGLGVYGSFTTSTLPLFSAGIGLRAQIK